MSDEEQINPIHMRSREKVFVKFDKRLPTLGRTLLNIGLRGKQDCAVLHTMAAATLRISQTDYDVACKEIGPYRASKDRMRVLHSA
jgi:hypothetical protein